MLKDHIHFRVFFSYNLTIIHDPYSYTMLHRIYPASGVEIEILGAAVQPLAAMIDIHGVAAQPLAWRRAMAHKKRKKSCAGIHPQDVYYVNTPNS